MTQENKELLLRDLCARLPYGVMCDIGLDHPLQLQQIFVDRIDGILLTFYEDGVEYQVYLSEVKPYLFPLESMTEEQEKEFNQLLELELKAISDEIDYPQITAFEIDFYNKHHFDWRGLISIGLALDATDKNIY